MARRVFVLILFAAAAVAMPSVRAGQSPSATLIHGASIVDGSGSPRRRADVRIVGDRIAGVGQLTPGAGDVVIDAGGLVLAPGFIDTHSHHDRGLSERRDALAMVSQGVTTIVVGQDGSGRHLEALFSALEAQPAA